MNPTHLHTRRALWHVTLIAAIGISSATLLATASPPACAADAAAFATAFTDFQRANGGDESAIDAAAGKFEALAAAEPADPVLLAYSGSSNAMRARSTFLPWKKMAFADEGLARLDKALALLTPAHDAPGYRGTPASLETKFAAATTFLAMPSMFNRHARGAKLLAEVLASPLLGNAPLPFRGAVWLRAGVQATADKRPDDARRMFQQIVSSGAPQAERAQQLLKEIAAS